MKHLFATLCAAAFIGCTSTPSLESEESRGAASGGASSEADGPMTSPIFAQREPAPEFVLFDQDGFPFPLAEQRGRWLVLHFYPESDTPDCACDATAFTGHLWRFNDLSAEVACVTSAPRSRTVLFAKKYGLQSPLLSDVDLAVATEYAAVDKSVEAVEGRVDPLVRTTLIIDPEGRIAARWDDVKSDEHVETILETLSFLRSATDL